MTASPKKDALYEYVKVCQSLVGQAIYEADELACLGIQ
jgi:hypothetical protein